MTIKPVSTTHKLLEVLGLSLLAAVVGGIASAIPSAEAGPLVRRAQERRACQEFAGKLQAASGNPQQAQLVYQQGVLKLVERFGENPCGDIPVPTASTGTAPTGTAPTGSTPAGPAAPVAATTGAPKAAPASSQPANPQQAQACQEFAGKLQAAQGNPAQAQQIYAMGTQKLSGMFGPNPCPNVAKP